MPDVSVPMLVNGRLDESHLPARLSDANLQEMARDAVAAMLRSGTGVTLTYDDAADSLTVTAVGGGGTGVADAEAVQDIIGAALIGVGVITVTYNDAANTITISSTATQNATDAALRDRNTHTGTQAISTVTGLQAALDGKASTTTTASLQTQIDTLNAQIAALQASLVVVSTANGLVGPNAQTAMDGLQDRLDELPGVFAPAKIN